MRTRRTRREGTQATGLRFCSFGGKDAPLHAVPTADMRGIIQPLPVHPAAQTHFPPRHSECGVELQSSLTVQLHTGSTEQASVVLGLPMATSPLLLTSQTESSTMTEVAVLTRPALGGATVIVAQSTARVRDPMPLLHWVLTGDGRLQELQVPTTHAVAWLGHGSRLQERVKGGGVWSTGIHKTTRCGLPKAVEKGGRDRHNAPGWRPGMRCWGRS
jgi:hypothetical protein